MRVEFELTRSWWRCQTKMNGTHTQTQMIQDESSSTQSPRDGLWLTDIPIIHHSAQDDSVATLQQARFLGIPLQKRLASWLPLD